MSMKWNELPKEIQELMLVRQEEQVGIRDENIFIDSISMNKYGKGFNWDKSIELHDFWNEVLIMGKLNIFYEKYPKPEHEEVETYGFNF